MLRMDYKNLFKKFNEGGKLILPDATVAFDTIPWSKYHTFEGVELKHIITSEKTDGQFSFHLVRIDPNKKIGNHIHEKQLETHEVISGAGVCVNNGAELLYEAGIISIFPIGVPHEVRSTNIFFCLSLYVEYPDFFNSASTSILYFIGIFLTPPYIPLYRQADS